MHSGRRSLTARRRSAKPQKRVRLPPAPLSACPTVPPRSSTAQTEVEHVAVGAGRPELLAPTRSLDVWADSQAMKRTEQHAADPLTNPVEEQLFGLYILPPQRKCLAQRLNSKTGALFTWT